MSRARSTSARAEPPQPESATLTCSRAKSSRLVAVAPATATTAFIRCASTQRAARSQATRYSVRSTSSSRWIWTWVSRSMATGPGVSTPTIANLAAESLRGPGGSATRTTGDMATANGVDSNMCSSLVGATDRNGRPVDTAAPQVRRSDQSTRPARSRAASPESRVASRESKPGRACTGDDRRFCRYRPAWTDRHAPAWTDRHAPAGTDRHAPAWTYRPAWTDRHAPAGTDRHAPAGTDPSGSGALGLHHLTATQPAVPVAKDGVHQQADEKPDDEAHPGQHLQLC